MSERIIAQERDLPLTYAGLQIVSKEAELTPLPPSAAWGATSGIGSYAAPARTPYVAPTQVVQVCYYRCVHDGYCKLHRNSILLVMRFVHSSPGWLYINCVFSSEILIWLGECVAAILARGECLLNARNRRLLTKWLLTFFTGDCRGGAAHC